MIDHLADTVLAARAWTRVLALGPNASHVRYAVRVHDTLGSTSLVRVSNVILQTAAGTCAVLLFTGGVRSAGGWCTGRHVFEDRRYN